MSRAACLLVGLAAMLGLIHMCWADQEAGVVAYYSFEEGADETVKDWSGNGNDGEIHGAEYVDLEEGRGLVLRFGDGEAYVDCGNGPSLDLSSAATIEMWLYAETTPYWGVAGLVGKRHNSYVLGYDGFNCWWYVDGGGNGIGAQLPSHSWHYVATTFDGTDVTVYIDGALASTRRSKYAKINTDGSLGSWHATTSFSIARGAHTSVLFDDFVYVIGGVVAPGYMLNDVQFAKIQE